MILTKEQVETILHHRHGGEVASRRKDQPNESFEIDVDPVWNFQDYEYKKHNESMYFYLLFNKERYIGISSSSFEEIVRIANDRKTPDDQISKYKKVWTEKASSLASHGM